MIDLKHSTQRRPFARLLTVRGDCLIQLSGSLSLIIMFTCYPVHSYTVAWLVYCTCSDTNVKQLFVMSRRGHMWPEGKQLLQKRPSQSPVESCDNVIRPITLLEPNPVHLNTVSHPSIDIKPALLTCNGRCFEWVKLLLNACPE